MTDAIIALCTIELYLPGLHSLKQKRGILKSMLTRMRQTFNVSAAEVGHHDKWQSAVIAVATVSNSSVYNQQVVDKVLDWIETAYPDVLINRHATERL